MFVKRECKQCLFYEPKENAHLQAAAAIHRTLFNYDKWFRSGTMLHSNLRQNVKAKTDSFPF